MQKKWLIVVVGPTAVGKTGYTIELAKKLGTVIVSCDSRQMYRELRIGVARPSFEQLNKVQHYFIGNLSIHDYYNASMFENEAMALLEKLFQNLNVVVMTGGSGLYADAVCNGIDDYPTTDPEVRANLKEQYNTIGIEGLRQQLKRIDPEYYAQVDLRNPKRILKALEVFVMTGRPYTSFLKKGKKERSFSILKIALNRDRSELHQSINHRVDDMIMKGLVEEANRLYPLKQLNALNTVGYKELFDFFEHVTDLNTATELIKRNTRRYARRQISYFTRDKEIQWFHPDEASGIANFIESRLSITPSIYH